MAVRPLPEILQQKAIFELNEDPNRINADISHIREWALKHPHLKIRTDAQWLLSFLRGSKFSLQKTKEKLDLFYSMRSVAKELYTDRNPFLLDIQILFKSNIIVQLPNSSNILDPIRFLIVAKNSNPERVLVTTGIKSVLMLLDILTCENDACVINGQEVIYDLKDCPYNYLAQLTPSILKVIVGLLQNAYPSRVKGIYFINTPSFLYKLILLFKSFLSEKLKQRVHFYEQNNINKFHNNVPVSIFPKEYGGNSGSLEELSDKLRLKVETYHHWFREDSKYGLDISKRSGGVKQVMESDFGIGGSFRKLNVD